MFKFFFILMAIFKKNLFEVIFSSTDNKSSFEKINYDDKFFYFIHRENAKLTKYLVLN